MNLEIDKKPLKKEKWKRYMYILSQKSTKSRHTSCLATLYIYYDESMLLQQPQSVPSLKSKNATVMLK